MAEKDRTLRSSRDHFDGKILIFLITSAIVVSLITSMLISPPPASNVPAHISYVTHASISINGNLEFLGPNSTTGVSRGSGSASDPYVIEGWEINASAADGIIIGNTSAYLVIHGVYIHEGNHAGHCGIVIDNSTNIHLSNNTCIGNYYGISLLSSDNNTIINNTCSSNDLDGISLLSSDNNTITGNNCSLSVGSCGILTYFSNNTLIIDNDCWNNFGNGIGSGWGDNSTIVNNICLDNNDGISAFTATNFKLTNNTCGRGDSGISCYYISNGTTLSNNTCFDNNNMGIYIAVSNDSELIDNACTSNIYDGIVISTSNNITLFRNNCSSNERNRGIFISQSDGNTIRENIIMSNADAGISLETTSGNMIVSNIIRSNVAYGLYISSDCSSNFIWNNVFDHNNGAGSSFDGSHFQAYDDGTNNKWDIAVRGNHWNDWAVLDNTAPWGVVDVSYSVAGGAWSNDHYPLMVIPNKTPSIGFVAFNSGANYTNSTSVSLTTSAGSGFHGLVHVRLSVDNVTWGGWEPYWTSKTWTLPSEDGPKMIYAQFKDNTGNPFLSSEYTIVLDMTAPLLDFVQTNGTTLQTSSPLIEWTMSDAMSGIAGVQISVDGIAFESLNKTTTSFDASALLSGTHNLTVRVIDNAGNLQEGFISFNVAAVDTFAGDSLLILVIVLIAAAAGTWLIIIMSRRKKKESVRKNDDTSSTALPDRIPGPLYPVEEQSERALSSVTQTQAQRPSIAVQRRKIPRKVVAQIFIIVAVSATLTICGFLLYQTRLSIQVWNDAGSYDIAVGIYVDQGRVALQVIKPGQSFSLSMIIGTGKHLVGIDFAQWFTSNLDGVIGESWNAYVGLGATTSINVHYPHGPS